MKVSAQWNLGRARNLLLLDLFKARKQLITFTMALREQTPGETRKYITKDSLPKTSAITVSTIIFLFLIVSCNNAF